jgi:hypothetical protein
MRRLVAPILLAALLVTGCSGTPSDGRIRAEVTEALTAHGADKLYDVQGFKVVSGQQQDSNTYVAKVHYDLVLKRGINRLPKELESDPKLIRTLMVLGAAMARAVISGTPIEVGSHIPVDDEVTLVKGDGGWVLQGT